MEIIYDCAHIQRKMETQSVSTCYFLLLVMRINFFSLCNWSLHTMNQERVRDRVLIKALTKGFGDSNVRQGGSLRRPLKVIQPE